LILKKSPTLNEPLCVNCDKVDWSFAFASDVSRRSRFRFALFGGEFI
jgi:hypothetical protein